MSVIIGTLFCVGLEMMLDFNLIPNNFRYKKIFKNSNLPLEIISQDGKTRIATNHSINLKENIINEYEKDFITIQLIVDKEKSPYSTISTCTFFR